MEDHVICRESITSSFQIWNPLISFSSLMTVAKTSKTMLNSSGDIEHPCLVPDFRGNAFNFFPIEDNVCCGFIIYGFYYAEMFLLFLLSGSVGFFFFLS